MFPLATTRSPITLNELTNRLSFGSHLLNPEFRLAGEGYRKVFADLDSAIRTLGSMKDIEPVSRQFYDLFFSPHPQSLLHHSLNDDRSTSTVHYRELPLSFRWALDQRRLADQREEYRLTLTELFLLHFLLLIRLHSANDFWHPLFLDGLRETLRVFMDTSGEWVRRFFKMFEYCLVAELPYVAAQPANPALFDDPVVMLRFNSGLVPFYKFYIDSCHTALKAEYLANPRGYRTPKAMPGLQEFVSKFEILFDSLVSIAIQHKTTSFLNVAEVLGRFLSMEGGDFGEALRERAALIYPHLLAKFLLLARDSTLTTPEHYKVFEDIVRPLARKDQGKYRRFLDGQPGLAREPSILLDIYLNSTYPDLWERAKRSYEMVAKEMGEFTEHDQQLLSARVSDLERRSEEMVSQRSAVPREPVVEETDWNYPYDVSGEWTLLFKLALKIGRWLDSLKGQTPQTPEDMPRLWKYHNGERVWVNNTLLQGETIPATKVRWMAQWRFWVKAAIFLLAVVWLGKGSLFDGLWL